MAAEYSYRSPDGGAVRVASGLDLTVVHTGIMSVTWGRQRRNQITCGRSGFGLRSVALDYGIEEGEYSDQYTVQGGTLFVHRFYSADHGDNIVVACWEGHDFAAFTRLIDPPGGVLDALALFERLELDETNEDGLTIGSVEQDTEIVRSVPGAPRIMTHIFDVGPMAIMEGTPAAREGLPRWSGLEVEGGSLYASSSDSFLLEGPTAVTSIFADGHHVSEDELAAFLSSLRVDWSAGDAARPTRSQLEAAR